MLEIKDWVFFPLQLTVQQKSMYSYTKFKIFHLMWPQDKRCALIRLEHIKAEVLREEIQWCCMGNIDILVSSLTTVKNLCANFRIQSGSGPIATESMWVFKRTLIRKQFLLVNLKFGNFLHIFVPSLLNVFGNTQGFH